MANPIELSQITLSSIIVHIRTTDGIAISSVAVSDYRRSLSLPRHALQT
jgi:hypothetical protein